METMLHSSRAEDDDGKMLQDNYRAIQPLHHRVVLTSFSAGQIDTKKKKVLNFKLVFLMVMDCEAMKKKTPQY